MTHNIKSFYDCSFGFSSSVNSLERIMQNWMDENPNAKIISTNVVSNTYCLAGFIVFENQN